MVFKADVAISTEFLEEIREAVEFIPEAITRYAKRELRPFASQWVDRTLRRAPGPVKLPIQWETPKQMRWFFWQVRIGKIRVPYQRTGAYIRGWFVRGDYTDGLSSITVGNSAEYAQFVGGRRQQRFHRNTGWPNAAEQLQLLSLAMDERIEAGLPIVIDRVLEGRHDAI